LDGVTELAKLFKERNNQEYMGFILGKVVTAPPNLQISIGDRIILTSEHVRVAAHVLVGYARQVDINGTLSTMTYKDTIKAGDEVILMPTNDHQRFCLIDKAVKL
jgi:hypothetical protein